MTARVDWYCRIMPEPNSGCWIWLGQLSPDGYSRINGKNAHRVIFEIERGEIPPGYHLDHKCRVRCCVNPDHLEPVTPYENWRRGESFSVINSAKTHCANGHPYDNANTYVFTLPGRSYPWRHCRICNALAQRRRKARIKGRAE